MNATKPFAMVQRFRIGEGDPFDIDCYPASDGGWVTMLRSVALLPYPYNRWYGGSDATMTYRTFDEEDTVATWASALADIGVVDPVLSFHFYEPMRVSIRVVGEENA